MTQPRITQTHSLFGLVCRVEIMIHDTAADLWALLTDAPRYPTWNSTISAIEGRIRKGERIRLHVPGTERTFAPKISEFLANQRMVWTGGIAPLFLGVRTFILRPELDQSTTFVMEERFTGLMLPLVRQAMPDMGPIFARFASDLASESQRLASRTGGAFGF